MVVLFPLACPALLSFLSSLLALSSPYTRTHTRLATPLASRPTTYPRLVSYTLSRFPADSTLLTHRTISARKARKIVAPSGRVPEQCVCSAADRREPRARPGLLPWPAIAHPPNVHHPQSRAVVYQVHIPPERTAACHQEPSLRSLPSSLPFLPESADCELARCPPIGTLDWITRESHHGHQCLLSGKPVGDLRLAVLTATPTGPRSA